MIKTLVRNYKFYFAYVTLILFSIHYKKMKHAYIENIYISLYISPKQWEQQELHQNYIKKLLVFRFKLSQYL